MSGAIHAVIETALQGLEAATIYFQNEGKEKVMKYFKTLLFLFIISFVPSLPLIYYGITHDSSWALVAGGAWRAVCTLLILIAGTPIGLIYEIATGGIKGSGQRYVQWILGVFIAELLFTLIVSIIPVTNNPKMFPLFLLASLIFGLVGALNLSRRTIYVFVGAILFGIVFSFYFPNTFNAIGAGIKGLDEDMNKPRPLRYRLDDYKSGRVEFFNPKTGEAKTWYVVLEDDKIELLDKKCFHAGSGVESSPITKAVVRRLNRANWENLSTNNIIPDPPVAAVTYSSPPPVSQSFALQPPASSPMTSEAGSSNPESPKPLIIPGIYKLSWEKELESWNESTPNADWFPVKVEYDGNQLIMREANAPTSSVVFRAKEVRDGEWEGEWSMKNPSGSGEFGISAETLEGWCTGASQKAKMKLSKM